jgi:adenylate kinase
MNPQTFIFIGRSGCGKGTQAKLIMEHLEKNDANKRPIYYVETGAQFREFIKRDTYSSQLSKEVYARNERQPDFLAVWMWANLFIDNLTGQEHLIIDGAARSLDEAQALSSAFDFYKRKVNIVHLDVSRQWSEDRILARGRKDDTKASVATRLDWFDKDVKPAVDYFRSLEAVKGHRFMEVNGEQGLENVHADIVSHATFF